MTEPRQTIDHPRPTEPNGDPPDGGWLKALAGIFISPRASFEIVRRNSPWLPALILVLLGTLVLGELSRPYQQRAARVQLAEMLPGGAEQADLLMAEAEQAKPVVLWAGRAAAAGMIAVFVSLQTLLVWLLALSFQGQAGFRQALSLMLHLRLIVLVQGWASLLIASLRGLEAIQSVDDAQPIPGLNLLLAGENAALNVVWTSINPFSLWFLVLLGLGAAAVLGLPQRKAWLLAGLYWAATTAFAAATRGVGAALTAG